MRQRILDAIYQKLEEHPEDEHLQRQLTLISKASICTIHAFCLEVIKNHFYQIEVSPNFRIGDATEIEILKQEVLEDIFEHKYFSQDEEFFKLIHTYTNYNGDDNLKEILLKIYEYIQSSPFPKQWLEEKTEAFNVKEKLEQDFAKTIWGQILLTYFKEELETCIIELNSIKKELEKYIELDKFRNVILADIAKLEEICANLDSWDKVYHLTQEMKFDKWPIDKKVTLEVKEIAKEKRDLVKKRCSKIQSRILIYDSKQANADIYTMYPILVGMKNIILEFEQEFAKRKREKNIIDFHDIEHFALNILVQDNKPTKVAKQYQERFVEIAIDEYQDSNLVQEYILSTISNGHNLFMVGDVKQSIYKFRQARPELFISKYETYELKEKKQEGEDLKIQLFKNFRSRENILQVTNLIFQEIMSKDLGDIEYNQKEYLNLGAKFEELQKEIDYAGKTELHVINLKEQVTEAEEEEQQERVENVVVEAKLVANRIKEIINSEYQVYDKKQGYRKITYKDIVVLLRSTAILAPIYEKELNALEIPVFSDTSTQYLETTEIQTIMALLKIIDNPMQDIPLVSVMRSMIGGFDDNELIKIKLEGSGNNFYQVLLSAKDKVEEKLKEKIERLLTSLEQWRKEQEYMSLEELIWKIYLDTGYYHYVGLMPNGLLRQANLKMLFEQAKQYESSSFKGLFYFINFINKLKSSSGDMSSAKLIGENEDVVRIMSIHKSKGLEFPLVFLCGMGKQFNLQDLNDNILLHQDLGLGAKYVNYERRIQYNTLAKEAIRYQTKLETLSEEMRILYVALTRAKEKLIITGISKDLEQDCKKKQDLLAMYQEGKIAKNILVQYKSYLDWILLVYLKNKDNIEDKIILTTYTKEKVVQDTKIVKEEKSEEGMEQIKERLKDRRTDVDLEKKLNWSYEYLRATTLPTKTSVTKIKELKKEKRMHKEKEKNESRIVERSSPQFLQGQEKITNAKKGSLMHLCVQKMDEHIEYDSKKIKDMIQDMIVKERITKTEAEAISVESLLQYTKSDLFYELRQAKKVYKEQPFYRLLPASQIYEEEINEEILVQGIIDLYYINKDDKLILVDFKTDYVKQEQELIEKYKEQLILYKEAIEISLNQKVDKMYIYSLYLQKKIEVEK